ncbi:MAG: site-specific integrase [Bacteriovorax sp.]|nr:site-specific integrase [Bacteriovorax sp.]
MIKPIKHGNKWRIRPTDMLGKRHSYIFDKRNDAIDFGIRFQSDQLQIKSGSKHVQIKNKTCCDLFEYYQMTYSSQKRNPDDDASIIRAHLNPFFSKILLNDIYLHVEQFKLTKKHLKPKTLSNILTLLTTMLNVAFEIRWIEHVPKIRKPRFGMREKDFKYLRTGDEIKRFLIAAKLKDEIAYYLYAFAIYTGCRAGECAGLEWSHINFERRLITVQKSFQNLTKNNEIKHIPILDPLLPLLREWRLKNPGNIVFPNRNGSMLRESNQIFQECLKHVLASAGFSLGYITFHSFRHTFASHWMMSSGDLFKLQKILGHKSIDMTQRYSHMSPDAFVSDYGRLGDFTAENRGKILKLFEI